MSHYQEFLTKKENTQPILFEEVHDSGFSVLVLFRKLDFQYLYFIWTTRQMFHRKTKGAKTMLTHYLIKEEIAKEASRFSEVQSRSCPGL